LGWVSAIDREGRTIWIVDAHRDDGQRFIVHADEILTAFLELERAVCIQLLSERWGPHRDNGKRLVAHADEKLTAFLERESASEPRRGLATASWSDDSCPKSLVEEIKCLRNQA
jgi:hypothetical protein